MMADVRELLPLYALGILESDEAKVVERAVASDPALARELASYQEAAQSMVVPVQPPTAIKSRLLASVGAGRFESFSDRMGKLFDVTVDKAREFLGLIERPPSWEPQPVPGIFLVHFDGGPAYAAADCGFIRLDPGAIFPPHKHIGDEATIVLSGAVRDGATGRVLHAGDELFQAAGSEHYLICEGNEPCIFAARAMDGISVAGAPVRPHRH